MIDVPIANAIQHPRDPSRGSNGLLAPSRRTLVCTVALLTVTALPAWVVDTRSTQNIIVIDGWILLDTDIR
jgi:hypothetical protein